MYCLLQSYSRRRAFVAAQSPLESPRADVWELVWQFKIKTVVLLCPLKEGKKVGALLVVYMCNTCSVCWYRTVQDSIELKTLNFAGNVLQVLA